MGRKTTETEGRIESVLAKALALGTWLISAVISAGLLLSFFSAGMPYGPQVVMAGIGLFILLPITRVILMLRRNADVVLQTLFADERLTGPKPFAN